MKFFIGIITAIAAITGVVYCFIIRRSKHDDIRKGIDDLNSEINESTNSELYETIKKDTIKQKSVSNIKERHHEAGGYIKESLEIINENSLNNGEKSESRLKQIADDLEDI